MLEIDVHSCLALHLRLHDAQLFANDEDFSPSLKPWTRGAR